MKTIKTVNGMKKIDETNVNLVSIQLRTILQDHRATLIDKLIAGGIETYVDYKFNIKISPKKIQTLKLNLENLKDSGIDPEHYSSIYEAVAKNDFVSLDNSIFYNEIDLNLKGYVFDPKLFFREGRQVFLQ
jgi:hypothetical protein